MTKFLSLGIIWTLILFSACKNQSTESQQSGEIQSNQDTISSKYFSEIMNNDSVKILDYKKYKTEYSDEVESIKYVDFRNNNSEKNRLRKIKIDSLLTKVQIANQANGETKVSLTSNHPELLGLYLPSEKLSNDYCFYYYDIEYYILLTDSLYITNDMEGLMGSYYSDISKEGDIITIQTQDNPYTSKIEIKLTNDKYNASVWRFSSKTNPNSFYYRLFIPISNISKVPILYTLTPGELDDIYEGFDKLSLEEIFNK